VFGCGGDRDKDKRSQMGEVAEKLCDLVVITSDNPRTEDPMEIIDQIINGIKKLSFYQYDPSELKTGFQKRGYVIEPDRRQAIHLGIKASQPGDTILIAGKGDETYQIIRGTTVPFDDRQEAKIALSV
jgi:UDP-N-acetylmuramoyl-L-alanyl-D-glutamate--2,6-diaminopimelate ligase/murE/murF fusion protein